MLRRTFLHLADSIACGVRVVAVKLDESRAALDSTGGAVKKWKKHGVVRIWIDGEER